MTAAIDPVDLASRLIACRSITPSQGEVFDVLEAALVSIGFEVHRFVTGEAPDGPVENLYASRGSGKRLARSRCSSPATRRAMPSTARRGSSTG